mgnify:CR=1 FL=1
MEKISKKIIQVFTNILKINLKSKLMEDTLLEKEVKMFQAAADTVLSNLISAIEEKEKEIDNLNTNFNVLENELKEKIQFISELENTNYDLMVYIDELKMDLIKAQNLINDNEHKTLSKMYFSSPEDNRLAKEVINNLHKDEST